MIKVDLIDLAWALVIAYAICAVVVFFMAKGCGSI